MKGTGTKDASAQHAADGPGRRRSVIHPKEGSKGARTKDHILDAALSLFAQSGSNAVSIRAIANEAGISHPGVLRYFASKDDLVMAAIRRRDMKAETSRSALEQLGKASSQAVIRVMLDSIRSNMQAKGMVATYVKIAAEATDAHHPGHDYFEHRYRVVVDLMCNSIHDLTSKDMDESRRCAQEFVAFVDGIQTQWLLKPESVDMLDLAMNMMIRMGIDRAVVEAAAAPVPATGVGA